MEKSELLYNLTRVRDLAGKVANMEAEKIQICRCGERTDNDGRGYGDYTCPLHEIIIIVHWLLGKM